MATILPLAAPYIPAALPYILVVGGTCSVFAVKPETLSEARTALGYRIATTTIAYTIATGLFLQIERQARLRAIEQAVYYGLPYTPTVLTKIAGTICTLSGIGTALAVIVGVSAVYTVAQYALCRGNKDSVG